MNKSRASALHGELAAISARHASFEDARPAVLSALQDFRAAALAGARKQLETDGDGWAMARALAADMDDMLTGICELVAHFGSGWPKGLSLAATGGYGRGELAPESDLDLLFLVSARQSVDLGRLIEQILYLLWDTGLKVGHAVRSKKECVQWAKQDHTIATALLDVRFLFGHAEQFTALQTALAKGRTPKRMRAFVQAKLDERDARHEKQGPTRYMVEPNVKDGKGGLRDLHTLLWIARFVEPDEFSGPGLLPDYLGKDDTRQLKKARRFLWTVRCWLHFIAGRAEERLSFDLQPVLARQLKYRDRPQKPGVERLMKAYFLTAREVGFLTRVFCARLEQQAAKKAPMGGLRKRMEPETGFCVRFARLDFTAGRRARPGPERCLALFLESDRLQMDIHPDALYAVRRQLPGIAAQGELPAPVATLFLRVLGQTRNPEWILRMMNESGLLGRLLPEFRNIVARTQFNMYHSFTVDEHTLRAVGHLHGLLRSQKTLEPPQLRPVFPLITNKAMLMLAMLLHDTGKGLGDQEKEGGIAARSACARLGLSGAKTELVSWLVENHLLFSDTAQTRDLGDVQTIDRFVGEVGTLQRLRMLLAVTIADMKAVGPGIWTAWKGQLLATLYQMAEASLRGRDTGAGGTLVAEAKLQLQAMDGSGLANLWLEAFPDAYWLKFDLDEVRGQMDMVRAALAAKRTYAAQVRPGNGANLTSLSVWAPDAPGLFADLCALASLAGANIASARIFTTRNEQAMDVFYLHDGRGAPFGASNLRAITRLQESVRVYLQTGYRPEFVAPPPSKRQAAFTVLPDVVFDNDTSRRATLIECVGEDHVGLLHELAQTLNQSGLNMDSAHISTYGERAVDVFYVTEQTGGKVISGTRRKAIARRLLRVLQPDPADNLPTHLEPAEASRYR